MITLKWSDGGEVLDDSTLFSKLVSEKPASVTEAFEDSVREDCGASGIVGLIEGGVSDIIADWFAEHAERNPDFVEECFGYTPVYAGDSVVGWMTDEETVDTDEMAARVVADHPCILDDFREEFDDSVDPVEVLKGAPGDLYDRMMRTWMEGLAESDSAYLSAISGYAPTLWEAES